MSIIGRGLGGIRRLGGRLRQARLQRLFSETAKAEKEFSEQCRKFGISLDNVNMRSYYELLGLKYTTDQKAIKDAYVGMVKKYHPDVSSDAFATQKMEQINEAYSVLKDRDKKSEYDAKFSKGRNRMGSDTTRLLYAELLRRYREARNRDFEEFNKRVAVPQSIDNLRATVEETVNWTARFRQVSNGMFGKFWDKGNMVKRLLSANRGMLRGEKDAANADRLNENLARLQGMAQAFDEARKGIDGVTASAMNDIATEENNLAERLRRQVR